MAMQWLYKGALTLGPVAQNHAEVRLSPLLTPVLACTHVALVATRPEHGYLLHTYVVTS